jgi:pilus assembly protein CpaB
VAGQGLVPVLVVKDKIAAGTPASTLTQMVTAQQVPANVVAADALSALVEVKGKVASVDLLPGEQLVRSRFVARGSLRRAAVPPGLLEVTVALDPVRALGGTLVPGSTVGVLASVDDDGHGKPATALILHDVLVTMVQASEPLPKQEPGVVQTAPNGSMLVTLALDAPSVEQVVFAAEHGRLWLAAEKDGASVAGISLQQRSSVPQ